MITKFNVKSFKSLESLEDLELGQVNVFVGANGSGKSNLLEALGVLGAAAFGRIDDETLLRRGVRPGVPQLYKSSFRGTKQPKEIRFSVEISGARYEVGMFNPAEDPQPALRFHTESLINNGKEVIGRSNRSKEKFNPEAGLAALKRVTLKENTPTLQLLDLISSYCIYSPNTQTLRGLVPDSQQRKPLGLAGGRLPEAVNELFLT